jgi:hypothetical protein
VCTIQKEHFETFLLSDFRELTFNTVTGAEKRQGGAVRPIFRAILIEEIQAAQIK